ncbi:hypothetical protein EDB81DRAFT_925708 [Dactylonectria macrodidyma]|uniref:FAD-binding PCMH-type domain-containing protein n=1 Tax=Dactylonectria macrodidyma TaxID=307937 RepID=A0A9P9FI51_9HYPO|nr:hypothetical protein EDB81DRAFT_925708 [Dactylonectria macrodidyma]
MALRIKGLQGMQYSRKGSQFEESDYSYFNQQYATSSYQKKHDMNPALIVQPKDDDDVVKTVQWARDHKVSVAVKSGGHQYSGASSTGDKNIQIDLTNTYKDMMVLPSDKVSPDRALVYVGVSIQLQDFNAWLGHNGLFVPHGQCAFVCTGGHGQTGGYGQLGRSFGLLGDHIRSIRMVDNDGYIHEEITKDNKPDLFNAILGGSPGNFGIITHYIIEVYQAKSYMGTVAGPHKYKGPHWMKGLFVYRADILKQLLTILAKMSDDATMPRGYDLCVSVLSTNFPVRLLFPSLQDDSSYQDILEKIAKALEEKVLNLLNGKLPAIIVVYAQWCPITKDDLYDKTVDNWFQQFRDLREHTRFLLLEEDDGNMAEITAKWIFPKRREFNLPYVKRTYATNSRTLSKNGWVDVVVQRLNLILDPNQKLGEDKTAKEGKIYDHCKLSVQIQGFGGNNSQFYVNRDNGTSYSWRDSTVVQTMDCFHDADDQYHEYAVEWQKNNDTIMIGPQSTFSQQDKRLLWGSWGDWDMSKPEVWKAYYENEDKYQKLGKARGLADPDGTFTANPFAVAAIKQ